MSFFFPSKAEKALGKVKKKNLAVFATYADGSNRHKTEVVRVDPKKCVVVGFTETLREDSINVLIPELDVYFETRVTHKTHDIKGRVLFYCDMPEEVGSLKRDLGPDRYFVYPKGTAVLAVSEQEAFLDDMKTTKMYLWCVGEREVALVNKTKHSFEVGFKFLAAKLQIGKVEVLVDLEVSELQEKVYGREKVPIMRCTVTSEIQESEPWLDICRKVDRL
ncbi:hypothetical protein [Acanthopleuribacter pedis]|uniref:Uncharacterized protein n=1 Tax=Acanthopleuribacter pedis TaxID=442870 RepID=A0A8J7Q1E6_9BACT|nr:hypothetical protein [Acanthopleuribacter pedis]MBO1317460.1 hypothetical protein [Acanthopleuribacter pedis]